jgi:phosphatidylglycerophosphate synthase/flavodoxin
MVLNTFDGMIAIAQGKKTMVGEVVNALPDRYSDIFVMLGLGLCPSSSRVMGVVAVVSVLLVSYTGMLGKAMGVSWQHQGPTGKVDRLVALLIVLIAQYVVVTRGIVLPYVMGISFTLFNVLLFWFIIGSQLTIANRLKGLLYEIRLSESAAKAMSLAGRGIVVYDSITGNTRQVAEAIASSTRFTVVYVDDAPSDLRNYEIAVLGSLNIRAKPSQKLLDYIEKFSPPEKAALFVTFGMPLWGQISTSMLVKATKKRLRNKGCVICATFTCPGFHNKYKTYKGRPHVKDLERARRFGQSLLLKLSGES